MKNSRASHLVALLARWIGAAPPPLQHLFWQTLPTHPAADAAVQHDLHEHPGFAGAACIRSGEK